MCQANAGGGGVHSRPSPQKKRNEYQEACKLPDEAGDISFDRQCFKINDPQQELLIKHPEFERKVTQESANKLTHG